MVRAGLARFHAVASYLYGDLCAATEPNPTLAAKVAGGETGAWSGRGFYEYPPGAAEAAMSARDTKLFDLLRVFRPPGQLAADPSSI